ncbi:MAG TPA: formyltransferase [Syntrophales bacterium]|nr:formyltransferase [Syntrophales bacterium]HQB29768.1 formyltransferase [Syntrophales bacterium]
MKAVVFAYSAMGITGLDALEKSGVPVLAVFTHEDDPSENRWFDSVSGWAKKQSVPVFTPENVNAAEWVERIRRLGPDVIFSFYYRKILKRAILDIAPGGAFNLHGSLLPAYRGRCPVNWVLVNGETGTGVTLHYMAEKADAGDIVGHREVPIDFQDTAIVLYRKLQKAAGELLAELLPLIREGRAPRIPQDDRMASTYGGRKPEDGRIDWTCPVHRIYNLIRAVTEPYPGAFTHLPGGETMIVWWALPERDAVPDRPPGRVEWRAGGVFVRGKDGRLRLLRGEIGGRLLDEKELIRYFEGKEGWILT